MQLSTSKTNDFVEQLSSAAPTPGGGSAAALMGAQGAALISMVANLTVGKPKYAEFEELNRRALSESSKLCKQFVSLIDRDAEAFDKVSQAYKLPKETDEEKEARSKAIANGTLAATEPPYEMMEISLNALLLCKSLIGKSNINASSDLGVSALALLACAKAAWLNVLINLGGIKNAEIANNFETNGQKILATAQEEADFIYNATINSLK